MKASLMRTALLGSAALIALAATPASANDVSDLRTQIDRMQDRIAKLEADKAEKRRVAAAAAVEAGDKPRSWKIPGTNTSMAIGGYTKLDVLWDFNGGSVGSDAALIPAAADGNNAAQNRSNGGNFRLHARQSRFRIQTWTPTDYGEMATYIETDFFGAGNVLRLRHAYGVLGPVLAGQTWTTVLPVFALPDTLDFSGPVGYLGVPRQAMVRYTHNFGGGWEGQVALEDPSGDVILGGTGQGGHRFPDAVVTLSYTFPQGRVWVAGFVRGLEQDGGTAAIPLGHAAQAVGWGVHAALTWTIIPNRWFFGAYGGVGQGVAGKYHGNGMADAVWSAGAGATKGSLKTVFSAFGVVWTEWKWTDTMKSVVAFGYAFADPKRAVSGATSEAAREAVVAGTTSEAWSVHGNFMWNPVPQVTFGAEYMYFHFNRVGAVNSSTHRLQLSAIYRF
jgi:hypothetical protein